jgi:hypothetical protein
VLSTPSLLRLKYTASHLNKERVMAAYEVTMMYRVAVPEGTEDTIEKVAEFTTLEPSELMTELLSEAQRAHTNKIDSHTGTSDHSFVYLMGYGEFWSAGWYNINELPIEFDDYTEMDLWHMVNEDKHSKALALVSGIEVSMINWIWSGE